MIKKALDFFYNYEEMLFRKKIIAAVSGGADSMCMLFILNTLKKDFEFELTAAHVNHCFRGEEADSDEKLVKDYCEQSGIELHILSCDVTAKAKELGIGFEECGRIVRYNYFNSIDSDALIAVAHNLNDRIETMLFNAARGSSLKGLCSIQPVRDNIIRPLLNCTRTEIERFCADNNIKYAVDSTNADNNYKRNNIRNVAIPVLKSVNRNFEQSFLKCFTDINEDEAYLQSLAEILVTESKCHDGFNISKIRTSEKPIAKRAIAKIIYLLCDIYPENKFIIKTLECIYNGSGTVQLSKGIDIIILDDILQKKCDTILTEEWSMDFHLKNIKTPYKYVKCEIIHNLDINKIKKFNKNILDNAVDCDRICGDTIIRSRKPGDFIKLRERNCTKSIKKLFNETKIDIIDREKISVVSDETGIIWIDGFGIDERVQVSEKTKTAAVFNCENETFEFRKE